MRKWELSPFYWGLAPFFIKRGRKNSKGKIIEERLSPYSLHFINF
jgi:hypothetical protein